MSPLSIPLKNQREKSSRARAGSLRISLQKQINDAEVLFKARGAFCRAHAPRFNAIQIKKRLLALSKNKGRYFST